MYPDDGSWTSALTHLECGRCGERHDADAYADTLQVGEPPRLRRDADLPPEATSAAETTGTARGYRTPR